MDYNSKQIEILNISLKLFAEKGFDGTSIRDIAKAADINVAMVSYYFGSKEKLLEAIVIQRVSAFRMILENLQTEEITPVEKIKKFVALYVTKLFQNKDFYQVIHFEIVNQKGRAIFQLSQKLKENLLLLENIIAEGQTAGVFKQNCNSLLIPALVIGTFSQIYNNKKFYIEMMNLKSEKEFENYIENDFKEEITNVVLGMLIK